LRQAPADLHKFQAIKISAARADAHLADGHFIFKIDKSIACEVVWLHGLGWHAACLGGVAVNKPTTFG
jgi:hypothetical protein